MTSLPLEGEPAEGQGLPRRSCTAELPWKLSGHEETDRLLEERVRNIGIAVQSPGDVAEVQLSELAASSWWTKMQAQIQRVGASDVPVLVQGETGAGKEVVARQLHAYSPRGRRAFLKVNCAALPTELIESELFGYERGAFTGAFKNNPGKFELADGGTILLDEIGDMDFKLQAKLLQVLQDGEFLRLGGCEPRRVDVRVIAATHCDLERMIEEKRFREDLYYRLNIITIRVPPLLERQDEILELARHFLQKHATASEPTMDIPFQLREALLGHDWPGNIRELENVMRKLLVLRRPDLVADDLRSRSRKRNCRAEAAVPVLCAQPMASRDGEDAGYEHAAPAPIDTLHQAKWEGNVASEMKATYQISATVQESPSAAPVVIKEGKRRSILDKVDEARREAETEAILNALNTALWNRKRAAEILNVDYKALLYKMKKLGIAERASRLVS